MPIWAGCAGHRLSASLWIDIIARELVVRSATLMLANPRNVSLWQEWSSALSPESPANKQTFTCWDGSCEARQGALESLHTLTGPYGYMHIVTNMHRQTHTCTRTDMNLCACTHVPQQALNKQTVNIQRSPKKWKHITMLKLTYTVQVKQEKGVLVPLQKQGFSRKLAFSGYPTGKGHLHEQL